MNTKILIIDDEEQDRKAAATVLKKQGYTNIEQATGEKDGMEKVLTFKPDIVLIDVVLKSVDGFDVCVKIKALKDIRPKVIMITGHMEAVIAKKAVASGADELIEKRDSFQDISLVLARLDLTK